MYMIVNLGEFEKVAGPSVNKNKTVMKWISGKQHTCCNGIYQNLTCNGMKNMSST